MVSGYVSEAMAWVSKLIQAAKWPKPTCMLCLWQEIEALCCFRTVEVIA